MTSEKRNPGVRPVPCSGFVRARAVLTTVSVGEAVAQLSLSAEEALQSRQPPANHRQSRRGPS